MREKIAMKHFFERDRENWAGRDCWVRMVDHVILLGWFIVDDRDGSIYLFWF